MVHVQRIYEIEELTNHKNLFLLIFAINSFNELKLHSFAMTCYKSHKALISKVIKPFKNPLKR